MDEIEFNDEIDTTYAATLPLRDRDLLRVVVRRLKVPMRRLREDHPHLALRFPFSMYRWTLCLCVFDLRWTMKPEHKEVVLWRRDYSGTDYPETFERRCRFILQSFAAPGQATTKDPTIAPSAWLAMTKGERRRRGLELYLASRQKPQEPEGDTT